MVGQRLHDRYRHRYGSGRTRRRTDRPQEGLVDRVRNIRSRLTRGRPLSDPRAGGGVPHHSGTRRWPVFPISFAIVTNSTNAVERPRVIGFLSGVAGVGTALGPILGGGLSSTVGWRWVFLVNVPLVAIALIWAIVQIRESRPDSSLRGSLGKLDWLGVALLALSVIGVSVAIDDVSAGGSTALFTVVPGVLGSAALAAFAWWESRAREPLIPPRMWRNRQFTALVVAATIANAGVCVLIFVSTVDLQQVRGYSGLIAGLLFIPAAIALAVGGPVSGRLASRFPSQRVMTVVTVTGGLGLVALAFADGLVVLLILMAVAGFLLGLGFQFGNVAVQSVVRPAEAGVGAGILLTIMEIVGGMAVVIAAAILEGVGQGAPTAAGTTVTLVTWGVIVGVLGVVFGLSQWRSATIAVPSGA